MLLRDALNILQPGCTPTESQRLGLVLLSLVRRLEARGLTVHLRHDFAGFRQVFAEAGYSFTAFNPIFDPTYNTRTLDHRTAFWLQVADSTGTTVGVHAGRLRRVLGDRMLHDALIDGTFMFDEPPNWHRFDSSCQTPRSMRGLFWYPGGLWLHPDVRGQNLAAMIVPLTYALGHMLHSPDWIVSFVEPPLVAKIAYRAYRLQLFEGMCWWYVNPDKAPVEFMFTWRSASDHRSDLQGLTALHQSPLMASGEADDVILSAA